MRKGLAITTVIVACAALIYTMAFAAGPVRQYFTNKADVIFAWDYDDTTTPDVTGFKMYSAPIATPATTTIISIPGKSIRTFTFTNYPTGSFLVYLTTVDKYGNESNPSDSIQINKAIAKPGSPLNPTVTNANFTVTIP